MRKYGFDVIAMWETTTAVDFEFVYILRWPDFETMERQWERFLADKKWVEVKKEMNDTIGEPVQRATSRTLNAVDYSPESKILVP